MINETANVGRGHVPAVRKAADGTGEQVCMQSVVPARDCHGRGAPSQGHGEVLPLFIAKPVRTPAVAISCRFPVRVR